MTQLQDRRIRIGVGGWTYEPWRKTFYPPDLPHKRELEFASRHLTSIEINGTYYRTQTPATFQKWHDETPDDFVFALKAPRYITVRKSLAETGPYIEGFLASGLVQLRQKLGPINWQFMPTRKFDPDDIAAFLRLLPREIEGQPLRHAIEVRHPSFCTPDFIALARDHSVAIVLAGDSEYPMIADPTAPFVYARIMGTDQAEAAGYAGTALDRWASRMRCWASGGTPPDLETVAAAPPGSAGGRDVFLYVISGFKQANPAAAMALIERTRR